MKSVELLKIQSTFAIKEGMLVLQPDFPVPKSGWKARIEPVTLVTPDGTRLDAKAEFSLSHLNIPDPNVPIDRRWRVSIWLTDRKKEEVPLGSSLLVSQEIQEALLQRE